MCRFLEQPDLGLCQTTLCIWVHAAHSVSLIAFSHLNLSASLKGDLPSNPVLEREVHPPACIFKLGTGCTSFPK